VCVLWMQSGLRGVDCGERERDSIAIAAVDPEPIPDCNVKANV
jgi:hypothetical protein